jgi:hypothetical protein
VFLPCPSQIAASKTLHNKSKILAALIFDLLKASLMARKDFFQRIVVPLLLS